MRKNWDQYFMDLAFATATRSTCRKRHVGCILVRDNVQVSGGYNGSTRGAPHCDDSSCELDRKGDCVRTVHAEANAVAQAARNGVNINGSKAYVTCRPCWACLKLLANAGILTVYHPDNVGDPYPLPPPVRMVDMSLPQEPEGPWQEEL